MVYWSDGFLHVVERLIMSGLSDADVRDLISALGEGKILTELK